MRNHTRNTHHGRNRNKSQCARSAACLKHEVRCSNANNNAKLHDRNGIAISMSLCATDDRNTCNVSPPVSAHVPAVCFPLKAIPQHGLDMFPPPATRTGAGTTWYREYTDNHTDKHIRDASARTSDLRQPRDSALAFWCVYHVFPCSEQKKPIPA